ncbi:trans-sialidase [Trypanosoma cruzi]|nr:trans-sialidase [Trypanosoma cruzi]
MNEAKKYTQVLEEGTSPHSKKVDVSRPRTVVNGSDIYMLAGKYSRTAAANPQERGAGDWILLLVEGEVSSEESGSNKKIQWDKNQRLAGTFPEAERDSLMQLVAGGGSGVQTDDGTLVFPVEGTTKKGEPEKGGTTVSLFIYSLDDSGWTLSKGMSDGGRRRVYESGDKGDSWTEALGTLSAVWGNKHEEQTKRVASGCTTATFENGDANKEVMLVTLPVYSKEKGKEGNEKGELHLWLTDNTRIVDIGPVFEKDEDEVAASSLPYKSAEGEDNNNEDRLIALHEKKKKGSGGKPSNSLLSVRLTEQLQRVKEVPATWKKVDESVSKLCPTLSAAESASTSSTCGAVKIADGLVGFLSGNFSESTWRDEYLGVDATVMIRTKGVATGYADGATFQGARAEWPVGSQGENQLYHFANYNFTLVAAVSIDGEPKEGNIPVLGVKMAGDEKKKLMELSYDNGKKWVLLCGDETPKEHSSTWEKEKTQHVVILLRNGNQGTAYVDGERVGEDAQCQLENTEPKGISHFYIGGDGDSAVSTESQEGVSVTVTNVLL